MLVVGEDCAYVDVRGIWNHSVLSARFCYEPKTALKGHVCLKTSASIVILREAIKVSLSYFIFSLNFMFLDMKNLFYTFPASPISNIITKIQVVFKNLFNKNIHS